MPEHSLGHDKATSGHGAEMFGRHKI
ncbi:hypothetical protein ACQ3G4_16620 [bacterium BS0013]